MMYTIEYSKEADRTLRKWKKSNPNLFKKATKILMDIQNLRPRRLGDSLGDATVLEEKNQKL